MKKLFASVGSVCALLCVTLALWAQQAPTAVLLSYGPSNTCGSLTAGAAFIYRADCITFISGVCGTPADGTNITTWADTSGNGNTATVSAGTCTFHTSQINTFPAISGNNTCHFTLAITVSSNVYTFFVVSKIASLGNSYWIGNTVQTAGGPNYGSENGQGANALFYSNGSIAGFVHGTAAQDTNWHQFNAQITANGGGNNAVFRIDRASDGGGSFTNAGFAGPVNALLNNNGTSLNGQVAAIIGYQSNATPITNNETYLHCTIGSPI